MRRAAETVSLLTILGFIISCSVATVGGDLGCRLDPGPAFQNELSFTIPIGAIAGAIGALPAGVVGAVVGSSLIPDIQVTYGIDFEGDVEVGCPSNVCGEGALRLSATLQIESQEGFVAETIPPSTVLLKKSYSILDNVADCLDACPTDDFVDTNAGNNVMSVHWNQSISTLSISLAFPITAGLAQLPLIQGGISAKGRIDGTVTANLSCGHADHPISLIGCPLDVTIPQGGHAQFTVYATDPDYEHLDEWPATVPVLFEVRYKSHEHQIVSAVFPGRTRNSAVIRLSGQNSALDLAGQENVSVSISVVDSRGSYDGETVYLHFVENHAPIAKRMESNPITTQEFRDNGCEVDMEMAASDPDLPDNFGYDIRFSSGGVPNNGHWEPAQATVYAIPPTQGSLINIGIGYVFEPPFPISSRCTSSGICNASATWWKAIDCPVSPGNYSFPYYAYEYSLESGYGLASSGVYTLHIVNTPPIASDDSFDNIGLAALCDGTIEGNVLRNDSDYDDNVLTASLVAGRGPSVGVLDFRADGSFTYYIDTRQPETTTFEYTVSDGRGGIDTATVTLEVCATTGSSPVIEILQLADTSCPDPFGASKDCQRFQVEVVDLDLSIPWAGEEVTLEAIAGDGASCLLSGFGSSEWVSDVKIKDSEFTKGILAVRIDRSFSTTEVQLLAIDLAGLKNSATLRFTGNQDPQVTFDGGMVWVTVGGTTVTDMCMSNGPSVFTMDPAWYEAGCLQFRDLDGDVLTFQMTQFPRFGTANLSTTGSGGNYFVTVMYEIDRDEMLECHRARRDLVDQLTVQAKDPYGGVSEATMNIRFDVVNSPPVCENDSAVTPSGVPVTIDVLANDSDPDEDTLTIAEVATPAGGGASVVGGEVVYTPDPGICGTDSFTYTVDDGYEGQTTAWVSVEVTDNVNPVAVCQSTTLYLDANGQATLDPASLDGGSTDNCSIAGFDASQKTFACSDLGDVPVLFTVFDGEGNSDTCWTTVTVVDDIDPVAVGQDLTVQLDASGQVTVLATQLDNGSTDNCSIVSYLIGGEVSKTFTCAHRGINLVAFDVIDASGNSNSVNVSVTVEDVLPPTAVCQNITASLDANGQVTVAASEVDAGSSDNCGIASLVLDRSSFTESDIGDQSVTLTVTDTSGNTSTCTAVVTVQDDTPPLIVCPPDIDSDADVNRCYASGVSLGSPTATDNTGVDWTTLTNNAPTQFPVGTTNVIWSVDDIYGNTGTCTQRVRVTEPVDPTVSCPSDIEVFTHDEAGAVVTFSATASDNCDPSPQVSCSPSSGTTFPTGDTLVTCTATDDSGNTDTSTFTVTVVFQNDPPVALDDSGTVPEGGGCITISVLANDSDPDTDALTVTGVGTPQCGTTAITNGGTTIRYCTEGCADPPDEITFSYTITDGYNGFDSAVVTVDMPDGPIIFITPPPPEDE